MFPRWRTMGNPLSDTLGVAILLLPISFSYRELKNFTGSHSIKKKLIVKIWQDSTLINPCIESDLLIFHGKSYNIMFQGFKNDHASAKYGPLQKLPLPLCKMQAWVVSNLSLILWNPFLFHNNNCTCYVSWC